MNHTIKISQSQENFDQFHAGLVELESEFVAFDSWLDDVRMGRLAEVEDGPMNERDELRMSCLEATVARLDKRNAYLEELVISLLAEKAERERDDEDLYGFCPCGEVAECRDGLCESCAKMQGWEA